MQWHKNNWPGISHHRAVLFHNVWMILACRARWSEWTFERAAAESRADAFAHIQLWKKDVADISKAKKRDDTRMNAVTMFDLVHSKAILRYFCLLLFDQTLIRLHFSLCIFRSIERRKAPFTSSHILCLAWRKTGRKKKSSIQIKLCLLFITLLGNYVN